MNSTIEGKDLKCPCCGKRLVISFNHTMKDKHLYEIQKSIKLEEIK